MSAGSVSFLTMQSIQSSIAWQKFPKRENRLAVELFQPPEEFVSFFLASDGIVLHGSFILNSAVILVGLPESRIERRAVIGSWPAISSFSSSAAVTSFSAFPQFS